jgi:hypothetical protein
MRHSIQKETFMRFLSKAPLVVGIVAVVLFAASAANARPVSAKRFAGAYASVTSGPNWGTPYSPAGVAYPTGHGGLTASPDFQLER